MPTNKRTRYWRIGSACGTGRFCTVVAAFSAALTWRGRGSRARGISGLATLGGAAAESEVRNA